MCEQPHEVDKYQLLRRLSLDVRGRIPSIDEYESLDQPGATPYDHLAEWLKSDDFRLAMRRYHEEMLWPNVSTIKITGGNSQLEIWPNEPAYHISESGREGLWRGAPDVICADYEETRFLPETDPAHPQYRVDVSRLSTNSQGVRQEGWRWVAPYWNPAQPIKVCAFDAQATPTTTVNGKNVDCGSPAAFDDPACGCGTDLHWCYDFEQSTVSAILSDLREQLGRQIDEVTTGGRPYTDLLLSTTAWENGHIAFFKKWLSENVNVEGTYDVHDAAEEIPDLAYNDATWVKIDRGPQHAGVLTLPAYLLRFQTNRGRANHFRISFMDQVFVPAATLNDNQNCSNISTDLQTRCNCRYCHATLEPLAAHFATFSEGGTTYQEDNPLFPVSDPSCITPDGSNPKPFCGRFYVTQPDAHNAGTLLTHQYADLYSNILQNILGGPRLLAQNTINSGVFAETAVKQLFRRFLRRDMHVAGNQSDELTLLQTLASGFEASGYSFPWLVTQVVSLPEYRRAR